MRVIMNSSRKPTLGALGHVTKMLQAENSRKLTILNRYISVTTDFEGKLLVAFEHTINRFSFGCVRLSQPEYYFSFFLFFFFFFSSPAIYF